MNIFTLKAIISLQKTTGFAKSHFSCTLLEMIIIENQISEQKLRYCHVGSEIYP